MIEDQVVSSADAPGQPVPAQGQGGEERGKPETVTLSKAEVEALRRERDEARESERYWANLAKAGQPAADRVEEPADDIDADQYVDVAEPNLEGDTPEKLVDDFAAKGVDALKRRGFITAADAQKLAVDVAAKVTRELIGRERQKMGTDAQIMAEFPELRDQNSDLFKETAKIYQKAVAMDPGAKKTPAALYLAAQAAKQAISSRKPAPRAEEDEFEAEPEPERRQRAASQDGRTRGRGEAADDDMLGSEARQVIKAMGITEDEYRASAKDTRGGSRRVRRAA